MAAKRTATVSVKTALAHRTESDRRAAKPNPTKSTMTIDWARVNRTRVMGSLRGRGTRLEGQRHTIYPPLRSLAERATSRVATLLPVFWSIATHGPGVSPDSTPCLGVT